MPKNRHILTLADLYDVMNHVRDSSELFQVPTNKTLQKEYKTRLNALGIIIIKDEGLTVGGFQTLPRETRLKPDSKQLAAEFLAWLREKKLHP